MKNDHDKKIMYCPGCDKRFGGRDQIIVRGGLVRCPNCEVELKYIRDGLTTTGIIVDEIHTDERRK